MIINTNYRMGSYIDLCRCPCNNGCWQTSCPPLNCCNPCPPPNCFDNPCNPSFNCPNCNNNCNCNIFSPQNALFFLAGYMINKK